MLEKISLIDLTHPLNETAPTWSGSCGFQKKLVGDYEPHGFRVYEYQLIAGTGTHLDAPSHVLPGGEAIDQLPIEKFLVPMCIIDLSQPHPEGQIGLKEIDAYEKLHGPIAKGSLVVGHTGWSRFWTDAHKYRNVDHKGQMRFPTFSEEIVSLLLERDVVGIGIDTLSPDPDGSDFILHHELLSNGKYILENLTNLHLVPKHGATLFAAPIKVTAGAEAPVRAIALVSL